MSTREQVAHELDNLSDVELEQVAEYVAFLKLRARVGRMPALEEAQLAALYSKFADEDRKLAEEGLSDCAGELTKKDILGPLGVLVEYTLSPSARVTVYQDCPRSGPMVDFALTEEQEELRRVAREFAQNEIAPVAMLYDKTGEFPWEIYRKAYDIGLMNASVPAAYGGGGLSALECCLIVEELGAACAGITTSIMVNDLALMPILVGGSEEQQRTFLASFCSGFNMGAFCLTEPGAGSDVASMSTTAKHDGDSYILNGTKTFITNGSVASLYTVFATRDKSLRHQGIVGFIVPAETPGISHGKKFDKMGQRASDTAEVVFEDVRVPRANLLGREDEGFKIAMVTLDRTRPMIAAMSVGLARAAMDAAVQYAKERVTFGTPIGHHQAIQLLLADMAKDIEAARLLTWQCAWLIDQGYRATKESSLAKCLATDTAMRVTTDAVQVFGGYGYMKDLPLEKYMRDAKLMQIYEGTNQIQRLVIARHLLGLA